MQWRAIEGMSIVAANKVLLRCILHELAGAEAIPRPAATYWREACVVVKYPEMVRQLASVPGVIVDEAFMADGKAFYTFLQVLRVVPYEPTGRRRVPWDQRCACTGGRDLILGGDYRQLPPASGIAQFWSTWRFQNLFEIFLSEEDRRHERDEEMRWAAALWFHHLFSRCCWHT